MATLVGWWCTACNRCVSLDCQPPNSAGYFRLLSKSTGTDLLFGPGAQYKSQAIRFFSIKGTDTSYYRTSTDRVAAIGPDSLLVVSFLPLNAAKIYMRLNDSDIDTLIITYDFYSTKCCGVINNITNFNYNNWLDINANQSIHVIQK
jgi:hypothetical protein